MQDHELHDLVIRDGIIIDGTGKPRFVGSVAIDNGAISRVVPGAGASISARKVIDAAGRIVAPGIIDLHTHYDAQINWDPYCTSSCWHGVTTVVFGNCGFGFAPVIPEMRERTMMMMENTEQISGVAMRDGIDWDWETFPEWIAHLRRLPKGVNVATYLPMNPLLVYVMGIEGAKTRSASAQERRRMREVLHEAMDAGAIGFAFAHFGALEDSHVDYDGSPMPTELMQIDEAYNLAEVLGERGQGVIQAIVEGGPSASRNRDLSRELARISGRPVLHNVVGANDAFPNFHLEFLEWLENVNAEGLDVYAQCLTARHWQEFKIEDWTNWDGQPILRSFIHARDRAERMRLATDPAFRQQLAKEYDPAEMQRSAGTLESYRLVRAYGAERFVKYEGWLLGDIAEAESAPIADVVLDILAATEMEADFRTTAVASRDPEKIALLIENNHCLVGLSDAGAHSKIVNSTKWSTDMITWFVRDLGMFDLEFLHYKLSLMPATVVGFDKRGAIMEGFAADLMIYDFDQFGLASDCFEILNDLPGGDWRRVIRSTGIHHVIVNGEVIVEDGNVTGATPGKLLGNAVMLPAVTA